MLKKYIFTAAVLLLSLSSVSGQNNEPKRDDGLTANDITALKDFTVTVKSAEILCEPNQSIRFKVVFDQTVREFDRVSEVSGQTDLALRYHSTEAYHLMNLKTGKRFKLEQMAEFFNYVTFVLKDQQPFADSREFSLFMRGIKLKEGTASENTTITAVAVSSGCEAFPKALGKPAEVTDKTPPGVLKYMTDNFQPNKSASEVKIAFSMNGEEPTKPFYETNISAEPFELKRLGLLGAYSVVPIFLKLEKNDAKETELDKLIFGAKLKHLYVFNGNGVYATPRLNVSPLIGVKSEIEFKMETTTKFKTGNLIVGLKSGLPINLFQTRSNSMRLTPFIGFDVGYRLLDSKSTNKEKWIMRPSFGFEYFYTPKRTETEIPYQFEVSYIRRIFLRPEEINKRNEARKVVIEGLTTNPKDYFLFRFSLWQNKFISPFVKYTYDRDVPQYLLEDHKYQLGLQANFDWGKK